MRLAIAQLDPTVGDVAGNTGLILDAVELARGRGADVVVTGELAVLGYPPRDLLLRSGVVEACEAAVESIAREAGDLTVLVGHPRRVPGGVANSVTACRDGRALATYDKRLLPGYDVFDEDRYFRPGSRPCVVEVAGRRLGLLICEDIWQARDAWTARRYDVDPVADTMDLGCDVLVSLNANPFVVGKWERHLAHLTKLAAWLRVPIVAAHQVGANDDLIFMGRSQIMASDGGIVGMLPGWRPAVETFEVPPAGAAAPDGAEPGHRDLEDELFNALVLGIRDYCRKTGSPRVIIGLSGGIDSAVTACLAAAALGAENVTGVMMPSRHSSPHSLEDATLLAGALVLGITETVAIEPIHAAFEQALDPRLGAAAGNVTDENIQARARGVLLMAFANARGALVLATGNKSELAMGYCTIYGDMAGALSVLGDVVKTRVYDLARWINANPAACGCDAPPIPQRSITRPPSAELRPDQTDQDTLPPYEILDPIVERHVEHEQSAEQIIEATGFDPALVRRAVTMIDRAQYKRDQAALVLKVTPRTFGRGRPMPIAMKWEAEATKRRSDEATKGPITARADR